MHILGETQFHFTNGICIDNYSKCDVVFGFDDLSDESNFRLIYTVLHSYMKYLTWFLGSTLTFDESFTDSTMKTGCAKDQFECKSDSKCIALEEKCDGIKNCRDNSDEKECLVSGYFTHSECCCSFFYKTHCYRSHSN